MINLLVLRVEIAAISLFYGGMAPSIILSIDFLLLLHFKLSSILVEPQQPLLEDIFHFLFVQLAVVRLHANQIERVHDQHSLDLLVKGT